FGYPIDISTHDELGEAAAALTDLAAQVRGTLLASGADRATLRALLDELPSGVILFDAEGAPTAINCRARELCELSPQDESERAGSIGRLPKQAEAVEQVRREQRAVTLELELPWQKKRVLNARWANLFAQDGQTVLALLILDRSQDLRAAALE